jgi:hypothetical protein
MPRLLRWGAGGSRLGGHRALAAAIGVSLCAWIALSPAASASVEPGEVYVADPEAGAGGKGAILRVDRASGAQTIVSSGGQFENPIGVAVGREGELYVVDSDALGGQGAVFEVDPDTGAQQVVSSGGVFQEPRGIAASFQIVVADAGDGVADSGPGDGWLVSVNPVTGEQRGFGVPDPRDPSVANLVDPSGVAVAPHRGPVYTDPNAGPGGSGAVFSLATVIRGDVRVFQVADGGNLVDVFGVTYVPSGFTPEPIVVADPNAAGGGGAVIGIGEGQRVRSSGGSFSDPTGVAFLAGPPSELLAVDQSAGGSGAVFGVDPLSGAQELIASGGSFAQPTGIATVPPLCGGRYATNPGSNRADSISGGGVVAALGGGDEIHGDDGDDLVCGGQGNDRIESDVGIALDYGDDVYLGGAGDDKLAGGFPSFDFGGNDKLVGGAGNDRIRGNGGRDRVSGGQGRDRLSGDNAKDRIAGGTGKDILRGGKGDDVLKGGKGQDVCIGGGGEDRASGCERKRKI